MAKYLFGIDLGGTTAKIGLFDEDLTIQDQWKVKTDISDSGKHIIPNLIKAIQDKIDEKGLNEADCIGVGMGSPGSIHRKDGTVIGAYNLGWDRIVHVRDAFQEVLPDVRVEIENDANVAALGEYAKGAAENTDNLIFVTLGTGVGGGIICDGNLLVGLGAAGEVGHMVVNTSDDAFECTCGKKGCIETIASATGIVHTAEKLLHQGNYDSPLAERMEKGQHISAKTVFDAAKMDDALGLAVVSEAMHYLGISLSQMASVTNPEKIVLGGGVANAGQFMLNFIWPTLQANLFPQLREGLSLELATLGNDAGIIGAAALVLDHND
ncbi:MAG: ROK family glucokinase [Aerococcus sp.]|nr:ROK family glucokinase [Aerococcus sp.]